MLQAEALLRHRVFFLLGPHDLLCSQCLRCSGDLLRTPGVLLHGLDRLLLGSGCNLLRSAADLLHSGCHVLLGPRKLRVLCSRGLISVCR